MLDDSDIDSDEPCIIDLTMDSNHNEGNSYHPMLDDSDTDSDELSTYDSDSDTGSEPVTNPKTHKRRQYDPIKCSMCNKFVPHAFYPSHDCGGEGHENNHNNAMPSVGICTMACENKIQPRRSKRKRTPNSKYL